MYRKALLIVGLMIAVLSLCPEPSQGQFGPPGGMGGPPGMGGGPPGMGGGRGGMMFGGGAPDPEMIWNMMGGAGKDSIDINANPFLKSQMERRGQPLPPGGILTKAQFKADFEKRLAERSMGGGRERGGMGGGPPGMMGGMGGGPPGMMGGMGGGDDVENRFRQSDRNGDGKITPDEASQFLRPVFQQYDKNGDGAIDRDEYRTYMSERFGGGSRGGMSSMSGMPGMGGPPGFGGMGGPTFDPSQMNPGSDRGDRRDRDRKSDDEDVRPVVYRFGKMPRELPGWFEDLDTDKDGMVGLYEWRRKSRPTADFVKMDLNGDGYLTADEWLRYQRMEIEKKQVDEDGNIIPSAPSFGGRGSDTSSRGSSSSNDRDRSSRGNDRSNDRSFGKGDRGKGSDPPSNSNFWRKK